MFDMESRPTLWRVGRLLHKAHTHTPIVEQLVLESALESADSSSQSADSNANSPKIGVGMGLKRLSSLGFHDNQV